MPLADRCTACRDVILSAKRHLRFTNLQSGKYEVSLLLQSQSKTKENSYTRIIHCAIYFYRQPTSTYVLLVQVSVLLAQQDHLAGMK